MRYVKPTFDEAALLQAVTAQDSSFLVSPFFFNDDEEEEEPAPAPAVE